MILIFLTRGILFSSLIEGSYRFWHTLDEDLISCTHWAAVRGITGIQFYRYSILFEGQIKK